MCTGELIPYENCEHYAPRYHQKCPNNCNPYQSFKQYPAAVKVPGACADCTQHRYRSPSGGGPVNMTGGPTRAHNMSHGKSMVQLDRSMVHMQRGGGASSTNQPPSNTESIISDQEREINALRYSLEEVHAKLREKDREVMLMRSSRPKNLVIKGNEATIIAGLLAPLEDGLPKLEADIRHANDSLRQLVTTPPDKMKGQKLEDWRLKHQSHEVIWDRKIHDALQKATKEMKEKVQERLESLLEGLI